MIIQIPLDIRTHRLSRRATNRTALVIGLIIAIDSQVSRTTVSAGASLVATGLIVGVYGVLHRVSPRLLGLGDVLLVVPLSLAVAYVAVDKVLWWQLIAATTGAVHGTVARIRSGHSHVPFGPHLLVVAWFMLTLSL